MDTTTPKSTINKKTLAKGAAQALIGAWCLGNVALIYWLQYKSVRLNQAGYNHQQAHDYLVNTIKSNCCLWPFLVASIAISIASAIGAKSDLKVLPLRTSWWELTPFIPVGFPGLACLSIVFISGKIFARGLRNLKTGLIPKIEQSLVTTRSLCNGIATVECCNKKNMHQESRIAAQLTP